jgi:cell division protein FtsL
VEDPEPLPRKATEVIWEWTQILLANVAFTAFILAVGYSLFYTYQLKRQETQQKLAEVQEARRQLDDSLAQNESLRREAHFLESHDGVEKLAREKLGLIRPNEVTYVVIHGARAQADSRAAERAQARRQHIQDETPAPSRSIADVARSWWEGGE